MKDGNALVGSVTRAGEVIVEGHGVGQLAGFRFIPDGSGGVEESRPLLNAARRALAREIPERLARLESGAGRGLRPFRRRGGELGRRPGRPAHGRRSRHPAPGRSAAERPAGQRPARAAAPAPGPLGGALHRPPPEAPDRRRGRAGDRRHPRACCSSSSRPWGCCPGASSAPSCPWPMSRPCPLWACASAAKPSGSRPWPRREAWRGCSGASMPAGRRRPCRTRRPPSLLRDPALPAEFYHAVGYRLAGPLAIRADALERLSQAARRLAEQGPFLAVEALRQTHPMRGGRPARGDRGAGLSLGRGGGRAALPRPATEGGAPRVPSVGAGAGPGRSAPDSPFAALRDLKFTR